MGPVPVVSADQQTAPSLLQPIQAFRWFIEYGARHGTGWRNRATRAVHDTPAPCNPVLCAPFVTQPTLMMVASEDEMAHADYGVARLACQLFDEAAGIQADFLNRWLAP